MRGHGAGRAEGTASVGGLGGHPYLDCFLSDE